MTARTTMPPDALGTILSVWAHPDDETYLAGGIMAAARDNGQRVVCVSATAGELGTPDPVIWPPGRLGPVRRWEAAAAMAVLGVDEHHVHDLPDGSLADCGDAGAAWVAQLLDDVRPDTVLTFGADGVTGHPDHVAVHRWVTRAWHDAGRRAHLLYATPTEEHLHRFGDIYEEWGVYMTDERPAGVPVADLALHVHLDGAALDRKLTALRAMATQTSGVVTSLDPRLYGTLIADEGFVGATTDRSSGALDGVVVAPGSSASIPTATRSRSTGSRDGGPGRRSPLAGADSGRVPARGQASVASRGSAAVETSYVPGVK